MNITNEKLFLNVKDYSVSKEAFELIHDEDLDMLYTSPKPNNSELSRYYESEDYISHTDGKRSIFEKAYHFVKGFALKNKLELINKLQKQKGNLLDIGAGTGDFLTVVKANNWNVEGFEPNEKARAIAHMKGLNLTQNTSEFANASFDIITMWHVLEHVSDLDGQIKELKRLIKPSGTIIVAVPNFKSYDANYYKEFWAAYDVPRHLWHFSKTSIEKLFQKENLELSEVLPMKFDSFYVSLLSEKYKTGKMNFLKASYVGLKSNIKAKNNKEYSSQIYIINNKI